MKKKSAAVLVGALLMLVCLCGCDSAVNGKVTLSQSTGKITEQASQNQSTSSGTTAQTDKPTAATKPVTTAAKPAKPTATAAKTTTTAATTKPKLTLIPKNEASATTVPHKKSFFDDAVFIGDSVTLGLKNYTTNMRNKGKSCLGQAKFLCAGSLSYTNAQLSLDAKSSVHPKYNGKKVKIDDGIALMGAKKVFIMLGMNDFAAYSKEYVLNDVRKLIDQIHQKSPKADIYIESVTPIIKDKEHGKFNNAGVTAFNEELKKVCSEYGITYVDINSVLADENGDLNPAYCGDGNGMGIHMAAAGCKAWIDYLEATFK